MESSSSLIASRSVRPNRGALLKQIIEQGFDSSDEEVLKAAESSDDAWSEPPSSSEQSSSQSESTDSDFSDEESDGKLSDATSDSDAERAANRVRREEEAAESRKRTVGPAARGSGKKDVEHRVTLVRAESSIPWEVRMNEALQRAQAAAAHNTATSEAAVPPDASLMTLLASLHTRSKRRRSGVKIMQDADDAVGDHSSIMWSSSKHILDQYKTPVVVSFRRLPDMFLRNLS